MGHTENERYIFLDPDGARGVGLTVIVLAPTGIIYGHQCGGHTTEERVVEGFAVPLGDSQSAQPLMAFFREQFHGNPPAIGQWREEALEALASLVRAVTLWKTYPRSAGREDQRTVLELDRARLSELTEAWVPVSTAYGPGVLLFDNSD